MTELKVTPLFRTGLRSRAQNSTWSGPRVRGQEEKQVESNSKALRYEEAEHACPHLVQQSIEIIDAQREGLRFRVIAHLVLGEQGTAFMQELQKS